MTLAMKSPGVSSGPTKTFERVNGAPATAPRTESVPPKCKIFVFEQFGQAEEATPAKHTVIGDLVAQWDKDEARRAAMQDARRWAAETLHANEGDTVRSLRLRKGWSQAQLAQALGTSQPHIARIERGTENVMIDTCRRLAAALGIDMNALDLALHRQESVAQNKASQ